MTTWFLIIIYLAFISLGLPDSLLGSSWPVIWPEIESSVGAAGLVSMVTAAGTIVSSLASGYMVRKLGTGSITLLSCLLTAVSLLGFSIAPSLVWFIILAVPLGLGAGAVDAALNHYVAEHYGAHHMNWLHCFWGVGAATGPFIMAASITGQHSWRGGYTAVALIQFGLVVVLLLTLPLWKRVAATRSKTDLPGLKPREEMDKVLPTKLLKIKGVRPTLVVFMLYCGVEMTVGLWGASYLVGTRNVSAETAASWISLYYGGITLGRLITGFITLKVSNLLLIRFGQWTTIAGGIVLLLPLPPAFAAGGLILIGLGLAPIYPGLLHETPTRFGRGSAARLMGYQMAVAYTGTTLLPPLFGLLASQTGTASFPMVILVMFVLMLLCAETVNRLIVKPQQTGR